MVFRRAPNGGRVCWIATVTVGLTYADPHGCSRYVLDGRELFFAKSASRLPPEQPNSKSHKWELRSRPAVVAFPVLSNRLRFFKAGRGFAALIARRRPE